MTGKTVPPPPEPEAEHRYPCEQCGADLRFAPGQDALVCDHCGHVQALSPAGRNRLAAMEELDLAAALADHLPAAMVEETRVVACPNCGATVAFDPAVHAEECPYCATPVVTGTGTHRQIKPQAVLPFVLTEAEARKALAAWLGRLWFAPSGLSEYARKGRAMQGVYMPFWTFDADTRSRYRGQRGDHYYETRTRTVRVNGRTETRQERVQRTRWTPVSGHVARHFDDVVVLASNALPRAHVDGLRPWDLTALEPYRPDFLAGFRAEAYTVGLAEGHGIARDEMARIIKRDVRRDIGGDVQRIERIDTDYSDETFKHIMLPLWCAAYRFRGRSYRIIVNGQTGEVRGERPWSLVKIALAVILAAVVSGAVIYGSKIIDEGGSFGDVPVQY